LLGFGEAGAGLGAAETEDETVEFFEDFADFAEVGAEGGGRRAEGGGRRAEGGGRRAVVRARRDWSWAWIAAWMGISPACSLTAAMVIGLMVRNLRINTIFPPSLNHFRS
jgi:hypothetical protein